MDVVYVSSYCDLYDYNYGGKFYYVSKIAMEETQTDEKNNVRKIPEEHQVSFQGFFSLSTWKEIGQIIRKYLNEHEDIFKLIGFNVAIAGLFLNLGSDDIHLKRIEVFFLLSACALITWFILKSLLNLYRGKHTELYYAVVLIPVYIGGTLIFNIWKYLLNNFATELLFYFHVIGVPLIAIGVNLAFIAFFRLVSKIKKIEGKQLENFFLITLNLNLLIVYTFSNYDFSKTVAKLLSFEFNNLLILYFFFITLWSELRPFDGKSKKAMIIESIFFGLLIALPFLIKYILPRLLF